MNSADPSGAESGRIRRERRTLKAMLRIYCRAVHHPSEMLCPECASLLDYATIRLDRCVFGSAKPTCANCPIHCYRPAERERVRQIMRYAGPRMLWRHPILALWHLLDGRRACDMRPS